MDTASAYLGVLRDDALLQLERNHESVLEDKLKEITARGRMGELSATDIRQAESRLARAHVQRYQAESSLSQDCTAYLRLVGGPPKALQAPAVAPDTPRALADILQTAETHSPEVLAARLN